MYCASARLLLSYAVAPHDHLRMGVCREPQYYYHNSAWISRGLTAAGRFLNSSVGGGKYAAFASALTNAGTALAADIAASLALAVGRSPNGSINWVPPVAALGSEPFESMTESVYASYTNFRYFAEILSAGVLASDVAVALMDFREVREALWMSIPVYTLTHAVIFIFCRRTAAPCPAPPASRLTSMTCRRQVMHGRHWSMTVPCRFGS